jgi:hypothetical protein
LAADSDKNHGECLVWKPRRFFDQDEFANLPAIGSVLLRAECTTMGLLVDASTASCSIANQVLLCFIFPSVETQHYGLWHNDRGSWVFGNDKRVECEGEAIALLLTASAERLRVRSIHIVVEFSLSSRSLLVRAVHADRPPR